MWYTVNKNVIIIKCNYVIAIYYPEWHSLKRSQQNVVNLKIIKRKHSFSLLTKKISLTQQFKKKF